MNDRDNRRILLIDDNAAIHEDFRKILGKDSESESGSLDAAKAAFFGDDPPAERGGDDPEFELDSAEQGKQGFEMLKRAVEEGQPYAMAFVDVRMPPGWDGIETIDHLWEADPDLQVVICTAFSDYSWRDMLDRLGRSDRLLILKKPFDPIEVCQLASALTEKWNVTQRERLRLEQVQRAEQEARAYASSLETMNHALESSMAAATKTAEMKSEFLVHLSQRVQEELNSILGHVGVLSTPEAAPPGSLDHVEAILGTSTHLLVIIDEILDMSMIDAGRVKIASEPFSPVELVEEVVGSMEDMARKKGLVLEVSFRHPIPSTIHSDAGRIRHILKSLCDNAIKYTESGYVRMIVSAEQTADWKSPLMRFEVIDTGIGIAQEKHGDLFELFSSPEAARGSTNGAGLGLAISKRLAQMLGGDITVRSNPGQGSTFALTVEAGALEGVGAPGRGRAA